MAKEIELYYFRGRGRAESIRIILNYLNLSYQDIFIDTHEAMTTLRTNQFSPFGQVPILHVDALYLVQTPAIFRYLARKFDLYGKNDRERYRCDVLTAAALDWQTNYFKAIFNTTYAEEYNNTIAAKHLTIFTQLLQQSTTSYFVSTAPTFADLLIFELLLNHLDMDVNLLDAYPQLIAFTEKLKMVPQLEAYLKSQRRQPFPSIRTQYVQTVHRVLGRI